MNDELTELEKLLKDPLADYQFAIKKAMEYINELHARIAVQKVFLALKPTEVKDEHES